MFKGGIWSIYRFISVGGPLSLNLDRGQENKKAGLPRQSFPVSIWKIREVFPEESACGLRVLQDPRLTQGWLQIVLFPAFEQIREDPTRATKDLLINTFRKFKELFLSFLLQEMCFHGTNEKETQSVRYQMRELNTASSPFQLLMSTKFIYFPY